MKPIYKIQIDQEATFLERPNRFIAKVEFDDGNIEEIHVHDSGRIKELLYKGNRVKVRRASNPNRKTKWDLISASTEDGEDILLNSSFHRYIAENLLKDSQINPLGEIDSFKAEVKYGKSRIDFLSQKNNREIWIETKGVSLSENKIAKFPDAPSERAVRHLEELIELKEAGHRAVVYLLVFRNSNIFRPKFETDPKFSDKFYEAMEKGVEVYPIQFQLIDGQIYYKGLLPILEKEKLKKEI